MYIEVDQCGKIEQTNWDTVLAFSDNIAYAILILVNGLAAFFDWSGQTTREVQTASVRNYALSIFLGMVVLVGYFVLR